MRDGPSRRLTGAVSPAQVAALAQQQATTAIAQQVPDMIPPVTSSRIYSQLITLPGDQVTATTSSEQTFQSQALLNGPDLAVGQSVILRAGGIFSTGPLPLVTQRYVVRLGGVALVDTGPLSLPVNLGPARYKTDVEFIVRGTGTTGLVEAFGLFHFATSLTVAIPVLAGPTGTSIDTGSPVTVDTTQPLPLTMSVTFGATLTTSGQAANSASMRICSVHTLRPAD